MTNISILYLDKDIFKDLVVLNVGKKYFYEGANNIGNNGCKYLSRVRINHLK